MLQDRPQFIAPQRTRSQALPKLNDTGRRLLSRRTSNPDGLIDGNGCGQTRDCSMLYSPSDLASREYRSTVATYSDRVEFATSRTCC